VEADVTISPAVPSNPMSVQVAMTRCKAFVQQPCAAQAGGPQRPGTGVPPNIVQKEAASPVVRYSAEHAANDGVWQHVHDAAGGTTHGGSVVVVVGGAAAHPGSTTLPPRQTSL
jgi:hypothetical protein